ncbi:hypothetical protein [Bifidobacterium platyrrhinorum]|uniref:Uncharacterized protein n=1 Tax=Bifidobacterium platyrrhinorum TaxID=2661628 RepID=A0A6L9SXM0_9BIFI|nr:hypothetical protein [Bifidobacterium platyrrhinorum]NEG56152.1 hypothetical protein [Bifidobacterium platyrrhinorum]
MNIDYTKIAQKIAANVDPYDDACADEEKTHLLRKAQIYATLALADQIRLQTLITARLLAELGDSVSTPEAKKYEHDEPNQVGGICINAITVDDLKHLGIENPEHAWEDFG